VVDGAIIPVSGPGENLSPEQVRVIPYLAHGMTVKDAASASGVSPSTITRWKSSDVEFILSLERVSGDISDWHAGQLSELGVYAWDVIRDLLKEDLEIGEAGYREKIDAAKFIISKSNIVPERKIIDHRLEQPDLNISDGTVDIVARRIIELERDNEIVIDYKDFDVDVLPEDVACFPGTTYGSMSTNNDGEWQCHVCGDWILEFVDHLERRHSLTIDDYRASYGIDTSVVFRGEKRVYAEEL
jgi:transcriptional regulator with XRE-family HTH domain